MERNIPSPRPNAVNFLDLPPQVIQSIAYWAYPGEFLKQRTTLRDLVGASVNLSMTCKTVFGALRGDKHWLEGFCKYHVRGSLGIGRPRRFEKASYRAIAKAVIEKEIGSVAPLDDAFKKLEKISELDLRELMYNKDRPSGNALPECMMGSGQISRVPTAYIPRHYGMPLNRQQAAGKAVFPAAMPALTSARGLPHNLRGYLEPNEYYVEDKVMGSWLATCPPVQHLKVLMGLDGNVLVQVDLGSFEASNKEGVTVWDLAQSLKKKMHEEIPSQLKDKLRSIHWFNWLGLNEETHLESFGTLLHAIGHATENTAGYLGLSAEVVTTVIDFVYSGKTAMLFEVTLEDDTDLDLDDLWSLSGSEAGSEGL